MTLFLEFIQALPALYKLCRLIQKRIEEDQVERRVVHDVKAIHEAFDAKDPALLNAVFRSK